MHRYRHTLGLSSHRDCSQAGQRTLRSEPQVPSRSTPAQYPLQETRHCLCNTDHLKRLLPSAGASQDFALPLHPIQCLFVFLFEQKMVVVFFLSFINMRKEAMPTSN